VRQAGLGGHSNTSTIPLRACGSLGEGFARDFLITHFFNPPRYMRCWSWCGAGHARRRRRGHRAFGDRRLGKTIVHCKDTPGFIANRIGGLWMQSAINHAVDLA
jgi:3-hydroxyacyl-CoA dehydrogenase